MTLRPLLLASALLLTTLPVASAQAIKFVPGFLGYSVYLGVRDGETTLLGLGLLNGKQPPRLLLWSGPRAPRLAVATSGRPRVTGISADGRFAVGEVSGGAVRIDLVSRTLTPLTGGRYAVGISADGGFMVGPGASGEALRWNAAGETEVLGFFAPAAISGDGSTVVGSRDAGSSSEAVRWTAAGGLEVLGPGGARVVSHDGTVVAGSDASVSTGGVFRSWRWTAAGGLQSLSDRELVVTAMSGDGKIIGGYSLDEPRSTPSEPFLWDARNGVRDLREVLTGEFRVNVRGIALNAPSAISRDGQLIVGPGFAGGRFSGAYVARRKGRLPTPPPSAEIYTAATTFSTRTVELDVRTVNATKITATAGGVTTTRRVRNAKTIVRLRGVPTSTKAVRVRATGPSGAKVAFRSLLWSPVN